MKKEVREGYKITELGEIPNEWDIIALGEIGEFKNGINKSKEDFGFGCKFVNIQDAYSGNIVKNDLLERINVNDKEKEIYKLENDDIILVRSSVKPEGVGYPILFKKENEDIVYCGFMIRYRYNKRKINPMFLLYQLRSENIRKRVLDLSTVSANTNINQDSYKQIKISIPSVKEQEKIAEILSTVDEQIENIEKLIQKNQELKKGLMQQLLTKGIGHTEFKKTELGEIPKAWEIKKIEEICEILDSKRVPLNGKQRLKMQGDIPYYGANAIVDYINDYIFDDELILIAEDGGNFGEFREKPIAFYVKGKCWVNNHAHVLKAVECENSKWIFYNLVHKDITEIVQGGTRAKLNQKDLRNIKIPFPNLDEQEKIALILSSMDKKIEQYKYKKEKLEELKKGLMKQLLNGNIRVI
ncbi:restriction endonuclease subunit S [Clostridium perfringens]|uniref:restriction endonuclease subunit S n=1 Tax=Clostridium perfringens TaxID=1502 RepID=UPI0018E48AB9|nr:restriction endonuclease subunit S [Clostridium perfringens]ELC8463065.1 restriction endonuclease subunit S [Clostridium perfringens]MBI6038444.1 restriction endonuclease subunit S [Clostridium perfringens]MDK0816913.1 restriction endonuclease subunit S [Clostridium perfringens]MDK0819852.1 restriction endonuclease subunit S [Clostridium perfringens]